MFNTQVILKKKKDRKLTPSGRVLKATAAAAELEDGQIVSNHSEDVQFSNHTGRRLAIRI